MLSRVITPCSQFKEEDWEISPQSWAVRDGCEHERVRDRAGNGQLV